MRLGVTRGHGSIEKLADLAASRGIEIVPLPLIESRPVPFDWPVNLSPERVDWVFFTSANGVKSFFDRATELGVKLSRRTRFAAVGGKTEQAVRAHDREVHFQPTVASGKALFDEFLPLISDERWTLIYARGRVVHFDPVELFSDRNLAYYPLVCYESVERRVDPETVAGLTGGDYILFTAPSATRAFHEQFGTPAAKAIAIGESTAAAMAGAGWTDYKVMKQPDIDRVLEYL